MESAIKNSTINPLRYLQFQGNPQDKIYYGVELELEIDEEEEEEHCTEYCAYQIQNIMQDFAILKHDGSLDCGFETVSAPATLEIHRQKWLDFFDNLPYGMRVSQNTGMHVHVSRKPLSQLTIGKILAFINSPDNYYPIRKIAGRESSFYAQYKPKKISDVKKIVSKRCNRYEAVNLTNEHTIEIRIFAATTQYSRFMQRLEFVAAAVNFCSSTSIKKLEWQDFLNWLSCHSKEYAELTKKVKALALAA